ncbi:potassium channel family protein, partial [Alkalibacterium sp. 20]|uniref:potassium channel family protein n=1 Tax=Alkalibacterium sp. 20 TaxID=1798803 RepID=UPI000A5AF3D5
AIIPFHSVFAVFRLTRLLRITRLSRLTRVIGTIGRLTKHIKVFFQTNGFVYMMYVAGVIMLIGATVYSVVENINFIDSLWWAFVTSTTVGYGDIVPYTNIGRLIAVVLMLTGIGIFGALTSTITSFFMNNNDDKIENQNMEIKELNIKITQLLEKMDRNEIG